MTKPYLPFPEAALSQHAIALGKTRSGKSSKVRIAVEWLLYYQRPVTIIDRKGDWWGLKSSADGKSEGFPIVIFGGKHADVPLHPRAGGAVAELLSGSKRSAILDLKGWSPSEATQFYIDFVAKTFQLQDGGERHIVIPEIHNFAPKGRVMSPKVGEMLHWTSVLASEGQGMGLILLLDSQRPQKVHNDVLTSCETLIACRVVHAADRGAIKDWIDGNGDPKIGQQMLSELANMPRTDAYVWSPEVEFGPTRITWKMFETFDSFKPQPPNQKKLKGWADVDLEEIAGKLGAIVEEHRASDPLELKKEIARLKKELTAIPRTVDQAGLSTAKLLQAEQAAYRKGVAEAENRFRGHMKTVRAAAHDALKSTLTDMVEEATGRPLHPINWPSSALQPYADRQRHDRQPVPRAIPVNTSQANGEFKLKKMARQILAVLALYPEEGCDVGRITLLSGYAKSGGFYNELTALRNAGYMEGENTGTMHITAQGLAQGPFPQRPASGPELLNFWLQQPKFKAMERKILSTLAENPDGMTVDEIATQAGYAKSGGFYNSLTALRTAGVMAGKNTETMRISQELL